jgi:carboxylesterase type B
LNSKHLRSLSKLDLLEIMHQQELEIERLSAEKEEAERVLDERSLSASQAGSLAEASLMVSGILQAAQDAADIYLENIRTLETEKTAAAERLEKEAMAKAAAILERSERRRMEAEARARQIVTDMQRYLDEFFTQLTTMQSGLLKCNQKWS